MLDRSLSLSHKLWLLVRT